MTLFTPLYALGKVLTYLFNLLKYKHLK